ncbi:MAG TPA: hypothetical protein VM094_07185 [Gemmatimonadales bacterium]|nr:hypothetical protein [Gemmatimonadales bacterium]
MLRLNTFGGLVLQQDGQLHTGPASQRRRLALFAVVAAAGQRGASRDKLLALLWPDSEAEPARHSLYQAVHAIRRSVGNDEIFLGSTTLQLNPQLITSDVGEFDEAVESGSHEQAVAPLPRPLPRRIPPGERARARAVAGRRARAPRPRVRGRA